MSDCERCVKLEKELATVTAERDAYQKQCERLAHEDNKWHKEFIVAQTERDTWSRAHEQCLIDSNRLGVEVAGLRCELAALKAANEWHPPSERREHSGLVILAGHYGSWLYMHHGGEWPPWIKAWREMPRYEVKQ